jgi:multidrug resistance protein, MATE family
VGGERPALLVRLANSGAALAGAYAVTIGLVFVAVPGLLVGLFNEEAPVIEVGARTLALAAVLQTINAFYNLAKGILRGLAAIRFVAWVTVVCAWTFTPPLTFLWGVHGGQGAPGAWLALCVETLIGTAIMGRRLLVHPLIRRGRAELSATLAE